MKGKPTMRTSEQFWDNMACDYAAKAIKNMDAYSKTLERTRLYLHANDTVLELGCGSGSTALLLSGHVGHIWASDLSSRLVQIGREKAKEAEGGGMSIFCMQTCMTKRWPPMLLMTASGRSISSIFWKIFTPPSSI